MEAKASKSDSFHELDDDSLSAVLLWTNASDHTNLSVTSKRIRGVLGQPSFVKSRCQQHCAEVSLSNAELEQGEYDDMTLSGDIYVDKLLAGRYHIDILPLQSVHMNFHEMADAISGELQQVAVEFFNMYGDPCRVEAVADAYVRHQEHADLDINDDESNRLVYISRFKLDEIYRDSTFVCATAIRAIMTSPALMNPDSNDPNWSLSIYIPDAEPYLKKSSDNSRPSNEYVREMAILDMKNFLRAGFQQVKETVFCGGCDYVYCTPTSLMSTEILSDPDLEKIEIVRPKPKPRPIVPDYADDLEKEIRGILKKFSELSRMQRVQENKWNEMLRKIQECTENVQENNQMIREAFPNGSAKRVEAENNQRIIERELEENRNLIRSGLDDSRVKFQYEYDKLKEEFKSVIESNVASHGYKVIIDSNSLHMCSANLDQDLMMILFSYIPIEHHEESLNNNIDRRGMTPLMVVAEKHCRYDDIPHERKVSFINFLLSKGADLDVRDGDNISALGHYRQGHRNELDFLRTLLPELVDRAAVYLENRELEQLLKPLFENSVDDKFIDDGF